MVSQSLHSTNSKIGLVGMILFSIVTSTIRPMGDTATLWENTEWPISSGVERCIDIAEVSGSIPLSATKKIHPSVFFLWRVSIDVIEFYHNQTTQKGEWTMKKKIELDFVWEKEDRETIREQLAKNGISLVIVKEFGGGGGSDIVELTGEEEALKKFILNDYSAGDLEMAWDYYKYLENA